MKALGALWLVFGCGSSSATSAGWSAYRYNPEYGYRIECSLEVVSDDAEEAAGSVRGWRYENGKLFSETEIKDDSELSDIWQYRN